MVKIVTMNQTTYTRYFNDQGKYPECYTCGKRIKPNMKYTKLKGRNSKRHLFCALSKNQIRIEDLTKDQIENMFLEPYDQVVS
jgi:hypothetical protein